MVMLMYLVGKHIPLSYTIFDSVKHVSFNINAVMNYMVSDDPVTPSVFILGLSPWMGAMILTKVIMVIRHPNAKRDKSSCGRGLTLTLTMIFSLVQAFVYLQSLRISYGAYPKLFYELFIMLEMIAGSFLVVFMAEKNARYGIGGPSAIILINILINMMGIIKQSLLDIKVWDAVAILEVVIAVVYMLLMIVFSVIFTESERRLPVYKAMINNEFSDTSYLTIKISPLGSLILMYIMALFSLFRAFFTIIGYFFQKSRPLMFIVSNWRLDTAFGLIVFSVMYFVFSIVMTLLLMNPKELSENLLKAGDCLENIRPGKTTERYLRHLLISYTVVSTLFILVMIVTPLILGMRIKGDTDLFSLPFTVLILGSIILNVMDEYRVRNIGHKYEKMHMMI
jgi:preprotein translocase subunit SecY